MDKGCPFARILCASVLLAKVSEIAPYAYVHICLTHASHAGVSELTTSVSSPQILPKSYFRAVGIFLNHPIFVFIHRHFLIHLSISRYYFPMHSRYVPTNLC